jgi:hypothetical protein
MGKSLITERIIRLICLFLICSLSALITPAALAADCPAGDLNRDCKVNFLDFRIMAENWLEVEPNLPVGTVIINELLAHSHDIAPDWIELYNTTGSTIDISGWYLSDSDKYLISDPCAYKISNGTTIPPYGYIVFYENQFGTKFKLSENGESVYLSLVRDGNSFGMDDQMFGPSEVNVPFGRYTTSLGEVKFVAMDSNTPGQLNSYPKVGPVVISEIMYYWDVNNPDNDAYEYIELYNIENHSVNLWVYDSNTASDVNWAITKGVTYNFPYHTTMPSHSFLIVAKDQNKCRNQFNVPPAVPVLGPFLGKLSNEGENIELSMPGEFDRSVTPNIRYYIRVDNVNYSDGHHHENFPGLDPWRHTILANGDGESLNRIDPNRYGDDPNNWEQDSANPGV